MLGTCKCVLVAYLFEETFSLLRTDHFYMRGGGGQEGGGEGEREGEDIMCAHCSVLIPVL